MAGVTVSMQLDGVAALEQRLGLLARVDIDPLRDTIGATVESQTRRRLSEDKAAPDGTPWPDWSPDYAKTRRRGQSLLESDGDLVDSINFLVSGEDIHVGTPLVYGAIQHFGGEEVGIDIPAREYLGLSDDDMAELLDQTDAFISRVLQ